MSENRYWLLKTEPETFSFEDLISAPSQTTDWEGVRNYQARNLLRDEFKVGDLCLIYHSRIEDPACMGVAQVVKESYPDETAMNGKHRYFDAKAKEKGKNPWVKVDVKAFSRFKVPVSRSLMRGQGALKSMMVLKPGCRLSVQPVKLSEFKMILKMGQPVEL